MFKKDFVFRKTSLVDSLHFWGLVINGFLLQKVGQSQSL